VKETMKCCSWGSAPGDKEKAEEKKFFQPCLTFSGKIPGRVEGHECSPVVAVEGMCLLPLVGHPYQGSTLTSQFRKYRKNREMKRKS
jgi:hypothetical protein